MFNTFGQRVEARIRLEFGLADEVVEVLPVAVGVGQDAGVAVLGAIGLPARTEDAE